MSLAVGKDEAPDPVRVRLVRAQGRARSMASTRRSRKFGTNSLSCRTIIGTDLLQAWVHWLTLKRQNPEHALMHAVQRFAIDKAMQRLVAQHEFAER